MRLVFHLQSCLSFAITIGAPGCAANAQLQEQTESAIVHSPPSTSAGSGESATPGCVPGATRNAPDGCNLCTCSNAGAWACGDLPCAACRPAYTGLDAEIGGIQRRDCGGAPVWAAHPRVRLCCRYASPCAAPASWDIFPTERACRTPFGPVCTPGAERFEPGQSCAEVCDDSGIWRMASCAGARLILKITFDEQSTTIPRTVEPDLYELASATRAYQVTALSLIARASPEETSSRNETLALARRRASVVREALIKVGVPAGVIVADAEVAVCSGSPCTTLKVQSEELSAEQMRSGHGFPRRRKECTSGLIFRSELRVTGQEGKLTVELCRNGVCSRFVEDAARLVAWPSERVEAMQGSLSAFLRLTPTEDQVERTLKYYYSERTEPAEYLLEIRHEARPEQLSSGDRYRASVYRGEKPDPYLQVSRKVAYQESYPNGPEHDPVPCRHATIEARVESSSSSP